ncbi:hypothetical protein CROQUDRAFT_109228 [Cronartium quercuum f. sp. fusiforme G11]|uniref:Uncharacterized protein n=1 Tax=Cronartium quercuum f. sp. fusiforme G11 TaxID=708437 RepID=A0A9P6T9B8_9BASI|nr:hypothetical protein CROQUDRAFT_109228 [Cronartium quercuum f. sp. fusiforme G11]
MLSKSRPSRYISNSPQTNFPSTRSPHLDPHPGLRDSLTLLEFLEEQATYPLRSNPGMLGPPLFRHWRRYFDSVARYIDSRDDSGSQ